MGKEDAIMDNMKELHEICDTVSRAIASANEKIRGAGGKLSAGDADYVDKLTHTLKSVKAVIAMEEASDMDDGYSERGYSRDGSYRGYSRMGMHDGSYGRGRGARRDSMGRYSSDGSYRYSGGNMIDDLRDLMNDAPDNETRQEMQRLIQKLEQR